MKEFLDQVAALARDGASFATATVVARRPPVSAHLGDRAIVFADGRMVGFIGGACSREIIRQQALEALTARQSRLVSIRPDAGEASTADPEHTIVPMTCVSEGAVDVFVEPFLSKRRLVVVGTTPIAEAVARTALSLSYDVVRIVDADERRDLEPDAVRSGYAVEGLDSMARVLATGGADTSVVVASQGHYDEEATEAALAGGAGYIGLVASRTRGAAVLDFLKSRQVAGVETVRNPAGIDLGARTAPDVALSILAEIVQRRQIGTVPVSAPHIEKGTVPAPAPATAVDPICGMSVAVATARLVAELDGVSYYFCCAGCRAKFLQDPARYVAPQP